MKRTKEKIQSTYPFYIEFIPHCVIIIIYTNQYQYFSMFGQ